MVNKVKSKRYIPLDLVRGLTVILMIFCNNLFWKNVPSSLLHAAWNGFNFPDVIFPSFIFCIGLSLFFSLKKTEKIDFKFVKKTLIRFTVMFAISLFLNFLDGLASNLLSGLKFDEAFITTMGNLRITGVFFRLALVSLIVAFVILLSKKNIKILIAIAGVILFSYIFILAYCHGYERSDNNIIFIVDNAIFTRAHIYSHDGHSVDPEGLFSTLPCIAHTLIGYIVGYFFINKKEDKYHLIKLASLGAILIIIALLFNINEFIPINKKVWSVTFVLLTSGISCLVICLFDFLLSFKNFKYQFPVLKSVGSNSLFIYVLSELLIIFMLNVPMDASMNPLHYYIVDIGFKTMCMGNICAAEIIYSLLIVLINIPLPIYLYKKKIFIKL